MLAMRASAFFLSLWRFFTRTTSGSFSNLVSACLLTVLPIGDAHAQALKLSPEQSKTLGIETAPLVASQAMTLQGLLAQVVVPNNQVRVVSAPLPGLVEHLAVASNESVKAGQVIARVQSPTLVDIQRGFLQSTAQHQVAADAFERDRKLFAEGVIAESRFRAAEGQFAELRAGVAERRQALRLAGMADAAIDRLQATRALTSAIDIAAPMAGVVLEQLVQIGQRIEAAAPLYKIARLDPLWLEIQVAAANCAGVAPGSRVTVPSLNASGTVLLVGVSCSPSQTVMVRAQITEGVERLRPGLMVEATVVLGTAETGQWSVPSAALLRHEGRTLLLVQTKTGFRAQPVHVINEGTEAIVVSGSLTAGERVAVRGIAALKGMLSGIGGQ